MVDASGKDSGVSKWLEKLGHAVPDTISVASGLRYTFRMYEMPDDPEREWSIGVCMDHPEYNRTAVLIPVETNKWIVSQLQCTGHALQMHWFMLLPQTASFPLKRYCTACGTCSPPPLPLSHVSLQTACNTAVLPRHASCSRWNSDSSWVADRPRCILELLHDILK